MKLNPVRLINLWLPVFFWAGLIFWLSSQPSPPPTGQVFFDVVFPYLAHLAEFGALFLLLSRAFGNFRLAFILGSLYAFSDEWHQSFVPTRTPSGVDVLFDLLGMLAAWWFLVSFWPKIKSRLKNK